MTGLSVAHRAALGALIEGVSETVLSALSRAVVRLPGERAVELSQMLVEETIDRRRRAFAFAPVLPMFRPREDGIAAMTFPPSVLPRLWKAAAMREPGLLSRLDDTPEAIMVADRICQGAAALARDQADLIWPATLLPDQRETGLADLAACLDLTHIARRGLPSLEIWLKRPDGDQVAELRLMLKDCATVRDDGAQRVLEMLFAHLQDAALILRIIGHTSGAAGRESFLSASELAIFVDRLIEGVNARATRIASYRPGRDQSIGTAVVTDMSWCATVLSELDVTLTLNPASAWGKTVRDARVKIAGQLAAYLRAADKAVDRALPMARVQIAGRMTRPAPKLDAPAEGEDIAAARELLALVGAVRGPASIFGTEAERKALVEALTVRLTNWADEALQMVNEGEAPDDDHALKLIGFCAESLEAIASDEAARTVRRRAAVAGSHRIERQPSSDAA